MNGFFRLSAAFVLSFLVGACSAGGSPGLPGAGGPSNASVRHIRQAQRTARPACPGSRIAQMQCDALILASGVAPDVAGWGPPNFRAAYHLRSSFRRGAGEIVAVVDAFDNPNVASDLAVYRKHFKLGKAAFFKYNEFGQQREYPKGDKYWGVEIDLDAEMVSAICPKCTIYLIESKNNSGNSLYRAEKTAVKLGAHIISNSWGGGGGSTSLDAFDTPGVTYLASAGDGGYGMQDPADYTTVVSVGGTILHLTGSTYTESVWPDSGGGCSFVMKPSWQADPSCSERTGNDVSAVAWDAAEYDTYVTKGGGWFTIGGTSISSPLLAGVFGLAGNAAVQDGGKNFWTASNAKRAKHLHAITSGTLNNCPVQYQGTYICDAGTNQFGTYSGPAGWGTPNGIGAF